MTGCGFEAIHGHRDALERLGRMLAENRLPHGLLFSGPVGVGKATTAQALVAALFCRERSAAADSGPRSCGHCPPCRKLAAGNHTDLILLEPPAEKTQIPVERVREVIAELNLTPLEAPRKVLLVDDAIQMNASSANALLKTLEEPPGAVLLILITRRPGLLLPTIRSRCQELRFRPLAPADLVAAAEPHAGGVDRDTLVQAADLAEGSVARLLELCTGPFKELRSKFRLDMDYLPRQRLGGLIDAAEFWGKKDHYPWARLFLRAWFREALRAGLLSTPPAAPGATRSLLELARHTEKTLEAAQVSNYNPQLVLEALFIRL
ncbi:MAG: DNA polymerase III subunit delta', partial [Magnetococcales bacterium]|nr:DNA polymerase III subunit delta' [Magnetococcales bacterium]